MRVTFDPDTSLDMGKISWVSVLGQQDSAAAAYALWATRTGLQAIGFNGTIVA